MSSLDYLDLCRLCLVKDRVSVPIFEGEGDVRQIFLKITACLPVKVAREDKLPKKICDDCVYKVELIYQFWHTTANAEKQLLQWLGEVNMEDKQGYVGTVLNPNGMKPEQSNENRLDGTVMQQVSEHQNNMTMGMMDNMGLTMPMMMSSSTQQQITSVPIDNSGSSVQNVQPVAGPSTQTSHDQITQDQTNASTQQEEEEESSEEEENSDDECDGDEGLPIKEESEEDPNRTIEPTTFVNVSLACDEAGPSGLQQQKIADMPEMVMSQTSDVDPKTGKSVPDQRDECEISYKIVLEKRPTITSIAEQAESRNVTDKKTACKIFTDSVKSRDVMENETAKNAIDKQCDENETMEDVVNKQLSEVDEKLSCINEGRRTEDVLYKKLTNGDYICDICQIVFEQKSKILRHIMSKHSFHRPFRCAVCDKGFKYNYDLKMHRLIHQKVDSNLLHCCSKCNYRGRTKSNLNAHYIRRHTDEYKFACEHCGKRFKIEWDFKFHLNTHDGSQHMCDICGRFYTSNYSLYKHRKVAHLNDYKFHCNVCNKKLLTQKNLDSHMQQHDKTYECKECDKVFASKRYLTNHAKTHTSVKPYTCHVCERSFRTSNMRNMHLNTHSAEKPYICDLCGQTFKRRYDMIVHRRKHPDAHLSSLPVPLGKIQNSLGTMGSMESK